MSAMPEPPWSMEAEQAVIGGLLIDNGAWDDVRDLVDEPDFYRHDHRLIWRAMRALDDVGTPLDIITLAEWLESHDQLAAAGGMAYLGILATDTPSAANVRAYAAIVRDKARRRSLIQAAGEIQRAAASGDDTAAVMDKAQRLVLAVGESSADGPVEIGQDIHGWLTDLERRRREGESAGITTGFTDLDRKTTGLHPGDYVVIAGRPSMGKTALSLGMAEHIAATHGPVVVFSLEMPKSQLWARLVASHTGIALPAFRAPHLHPYGDPAADSIRRTVQRLQSLPLHVDDSSRVTTSDIRARARRLKRKHGLTAVVVDYIGLVTPPARESRNHEIEVISRDLKSLALELGVPVLALSQLNRGLEQRPDKRPIMSDLRDSGSLEQDADLVLLLYRDEVYRERTPDRGIAEIIIGKQRNGETGTVPLAFRGEVTRFGDLDHQTKAAWIERRRARGE